MHEGHCEEPGDLSQSFTFDGYTTTEYPILGGHQERPQVIARANNNVDNTEFGVLGAYDGHARASGASPWTPPGITVSTSTSPAFIAATDPASPSFDPAAVPAWEETKSYFRNVAAWLAPDAKQRCLRNGGWLIVLRNTMQRLVDDEPDEIEAAVRLGAADGVAQLFECLQAGTKVSREG